MPIPALPNTVFSAYPLASPAVQQMNSKPFSLQARLKRYLAEGQVEDLRRMSRNRELGILLPEWNRATSDHNYQHLGQDHALDEHNLLTFQNLPLSPYFNKLSADQRYLLRTAALFHDITKKTGTIEQRAVDKVPPDPKHPEHSAAYLKQALPAIGFSPRETDQIVFLVHHHSDINPGTLIKQETLPPETLDKMAKTVGNKDNLNMLLALSEADTRAVADSEVTGWSAQRARRLYRVGEEIANRLQVRDLAFGSQNIKPLFIGNRG